MILESPRLILRKFKDKDVSSFLAYRNDPEIARYQSWESCSEQDAFDFIQNQKILKPFEAGSWFQIAIELKETNEHIGDCAVNIKDDAQQAEIGFTLARDFQGRGYAFEAVSFLLDYMFSTLSLHRVTAITDSENLPSIALLKKAGMRQEGHLIQSFCFNGKWSDEYLFALLRSEWNKNRGK